MFVRDDSVPSQLLIDQDRLPEPVSITGNDLTTEQLVRVARGGAQVSLSSDAVNRVENSRKTVEHSIARGEIVYGLTTDLGPLADRQLHFDELEAFQRRMIMGHSVAHGQQLDTPVVRAMILTRINGMAKGGAGVRLQLVNALCQLLNVGVHPIVRWDGSIGQF